MLWESMSWMDVEAYLKREDRVVFITGCVEQHSYLSLLTDVTVPLALARAVCEPRGIPIAPPLAFGITPYLTAFPGTLSVRVETFAAVVRDVLEGLLAQGFRRILVSNGHGGNTGTLYALMGEIAGAHPEALLRGFEWWTDPRVEAYAASTGLTPTHANWLENFPNLTRVGPVPTGEKPLLDIPRGASPAAARALLQDGSFGGPWEASDAVMAGLFDAAVAAMETALDSLESE